MPPECTPGIPATSQIPRMLNRQYDNVVRDLLGVTTLASADNQPPSSLLYPDYEGGMKPDAWRLYQEVASKVAAEVMAGPNKSKFMACEATAPDCLKNTITTFGRKAFRRALTQAEVDRFMKLSQTMPAGTPAEVAQTTLEAFLVSPSFLMLPELGTEVEGTAIKLTQQELATRLSFMLWGSVPDDALNAAADGGMLATKEQILEQANRMLQDKTKAGSVVASFHRRYIDSDNDVSHWWKPRHDTALFPLYKESTLPTMKAELDAFFQDVVFSGGSFKDLFLSNVAFVTKDTAAIYGLDPAPYTDQLTRVELNQAERPGFLTRIGFLSSFSRFASTSPILRGAFVTVNMVGVNPGPPTPEALQMAAPPGNYETERAYVEALTSPDNCKGCHAPLINPPGFVLERYDAIGKWQDVDLRKGAINATATVTFGPNLTKEITTPLELMEELGKGTLARRIYAEKWVNYAYGRASNPNDTCVVNDLDAKLGTPDYSVLKLMADLTQPDTFRLRVRGM